ncbi:hypothetical protein L6164_007996 [Bauhinia variegata]|uniref:Uncharacterized protein n=1 Tax=Bauhinia variegata TaxID=167791 RepID=A0ACB9PEB1_BAUVA|nr:hypothetical protein L6164_007996 [Bauhinia variegata]
MPWYCRLQLGLRSCKEIFGEIMLGLSAEKELYLAQQQAQNLIYPELKSVKQWNSASTVRAKFPRKSKRKARKRVRKSMRPYSQKWGYIRIITGTIIGGILGFYVMHRLENNYKEKMNERLKNYEAELRRNKQERLNEFEESS